jgi:hypothetical protein
MINSVSFGSMPVTEVMKLKKGDKVYEEPFASRLNGVSYPEKEKVVDSVQFHTKGSAIGEGYWLVDAPPEKATLCSIGATDDKPGMEIIDGKVNNAAKINTQSIYEIKDGQVMGINRESKSTKKWKSVGYSTMLVAGAVIVGSFFKRHPNTNK